ncbi:MFS transporter [Roseiarcus fermentans]|uniref:MFS transporter n=1 Tax=Roseiarcus fermentans TaxID=1473586 RepID=A0A366FUN0_9HYPH|nr:MFS transporter [Roseiarcus fermentans]RBP18328.1 MFS transporter [Roseiarcus fermentans]
MSLAREARACNKDALYPILSDVSAALSSIAALLCSVVLLIGGNALIGVATPLRARLDGFPDLTIGLLGSAYFAGMLAGTLAAPAVIRRGGPIRAFAALVALAIVSVLLMPVVVSPWLWLACRALTGFVFAGLYAVIEAWINARATNANRGALYALYQIANFGASAAGQMALQPLGPAGFPPFAVAGALLALAIVPMAMTSVDPPAEPRTVRPRLLWLVRIAPMSCAAAFAAGAANGAAISLGPIFAVGIGMSPDNAPIFTSAMVLGSALGVFPVGAISDRVDRRLVMAAVMTAGAGLELALSRMGAPSLSVVALGFLVGLTTYALYMLAVSMANDGAAPHDLVFISVGLLFIYCVAAIAAPAIAATLMRDFGPQALFLHNAAVHIAIAGAALWGAIVAPRRGRRL